jgi:hypothetical protein
MAQAKRKEKANKAEKAKAQAEAKPEAKAGETPSTSDAGAPESFEPWRKPAGLSRRGWIILGVLVVLANFPLVHYALFRGTPEATVTLPYLNTFSDRATVERDFWSSGGHWRVVDNELLAAGPKNNPLWLKAKLPQDVVVEFDVRSLSPEGDIKVEIFGDGTDHASGYVLIHGGWNNSLSIIARLDEHGRSLQSIQQEANRIASELKLPSNKPEDTGVFRASTRMRVEANPFRVQLGKTYHWRIERRGSELRWSIDGLPFMSFNDPFPLTGAKHDRFGFAGWEADLYFDNLRIEAL